MCTIINTRSLKLWRKSSRLMTNIRRIKMNNRGTVKSGEVTGVKVTNSLQENLGEIAEVVIGV